MGSKEEAEVKRKQQWNRTGRRGLAKG
jgi:hypothetical protein